MPSARLNIELYFRYLIEDVEPSEEDSRPLVERALRLVHDGMPLPEALTNYRVGAEYFWKQLISLIDDPALISAVSLRLTNDFKPLPRGFPGS
ncbi:hypothetical protein [Nocardia pseudobrasiliensis]|uniref:RsbT co-antagonist protein RsbRD N-terminal domain-containing protein n=1 Tax=Nocardia pseudobrasiliensis TaxID=45979 RepID=A0A370I0P0_9NOCA|nr:hypothetical protein [Nocardia pseudobrasiliensis]RDI62794.1 hypothetical protein DFR76_112112 [Nocardia pseudobrasiliensis]